MADVNDSGIVLNQKEGYEKDSIGVDGIDRDYDDDDDDIENSLNELCEESEEEENNIFYEPEEIEVNRIT